MARVDVATQVLELAALPGSAAPPDYELEKTYV